MVQNIVSFLLWVLLAQLKPGWINFLECFLLILPCMHSITVFRLPYLLTCLQCIIHHYIMYPWLNTKYQIRTVQQWISVKCTDLIMQVQYAMRQKRQLCKICTPQIIPRNAWYSWVEYGSYSSYSLPGEILGKKRKAFIFVWPSQSDFRSPLAPISLDVQSLQYILKAGKNHYKQF